jgi:hypothetical protein
LREPAEARLGAARRHALHQRFARLAAVRLQRFIDPGALDWESSI